MYLDKIIRGRNLIAGKGFKLIEEPIQFSVLRVEGRPQAYPEFKRCFAAIHSLFIGIVDQMMMGSLNVGFLPPRLHWQNSLSPEQGLWLAVGPCLPH